MNRRTCPGCLTVQPLGRDGSYLPHAAGPDARGWCAWAGRHAVDPVTKRDLAGEELARVSPGPAPGRKRRRRRAPRPCPE